MGVADLKLTLEVDDTRVCSPTIDEVRVEEQNIIFRGFTETRNTCPAGAVLKSQNNNLQDPGQPKELGGTNPPAEILSPNEGIDVNRVSQSLKIIVVLSTSSTNEHIIYTDFFRLRPPYYGLLRWLC